MENIVQLHLAINPEVRAGSARFQTVDKKLFSPAGGRIALSANERIAEFLDFTIRAKSAYVNKPEQPLPAFSLWSEKGKNDIIKSNQNDDVR